MSAVGKLSKINKPKVIEYHDYRHFLKDWFAYRQSTEPKFSLRQLARDSKVGVSFISMMLSGHRGLSKEMFEKLRGHLKLSEREGELLGLLRELGEASTIEGRTRAFNSVLKFPSYKDKHPKEFATFHYLSDWHIVVVREMAAYPDFEFDARWIQSRLRGRLALEKIEKALTFLETSGLLQREKPHITGKTLDCMGGVYALSLGNFHKQMLSHTSEAIDTVPRDERIVLGHTFAVAGENLAQVNAILFEALKKIEGLSESVVNPNGVYHVTLAAVPLTKQGKVETDES